MKRLAVLSALLLLLTSCGAQPYTCSFFAFDTYNTVTVYSDDDNAAADAAEALCATIEQAASAYDENSELARLNRAGGGEVSETLQPILLRAISLMRDTDGAFSPTLWRLSELWRIGKPDFDVPSTADIADALRATDTIPSLVENHLAMEAPLDLGAIAKGYACEQVIAFLRERCVTRALVSLGGNIGALSDVEAFRVGIADPADTSKLIGVLSIANGFVSVSGSYERFSEKDGVKYSHILDPKTGLPVQNDLSCACVIGEDGAVCDALSTALLVMGYDEAKAYAERGAYSVILVKNDGAIFISESVKERFTVYD